MRMSYIHKLYRIFSTVSDQELTQSITTVGRLEELLTAEEFIKVSALLLANELKHDDEIYIISNGEKNYYFSGQTDLVLPHRIKERLVVDLLGNPIDLYMVGKSVAFIVSNDALANVGQVRTNESHKSGEPKRFDICALQDYLSDLVLNGNSLPNGVEIKDSLDILGEINSGHIYVGQKTLVTCKFVLEEDAA